MIDKIGIGNEHRELRYYQKDALKALRAIDEKRNEMFSTIIYVCHSQDMKCQNSEQDRNLFVQVLFIGHLS